VCAEKDEAEKRKQQDALTKFVLDEQMEMRNRMKGGDKAEKERETKRFVRPGFPHLHLCLEI
jgi:hypothetical protein